MYWNSASTKSDPHSLVNASAESKARGRAAGVSFLRGLRSQYSSFVFNYPRQMNTFSRAIFHHIKYILLVSQRLKACSVVCGWSFFRTCWSPTQAEMLVYSFPDANALSYNILKSVRKEYVWYYRSKLCWAIGYNLEIWWTYNAELVHRTQAVQLRCNGLRKTI